MTDDGWDLALDDGSKVWDDRDRFARLDEWVLDADISDRAVRLYAMLDRFAGRNREAFPSRAALAARLRCSTDSVDRAMKELVTLGAVEVVKRYRADGGSRANDYRLKPQPHGPPEPQPHGPTEPQPRGPKKESQKEGEPKATRPANSGSLLPVATPDAGPAGADDATAHRLANLLADQIEERGGKRPTVTKAWLSDMDRLLRLDHRAARQVETVLRWLAAGGDPIALFWQANVRSPAKLREKWDHMADQYRSQVAAKRALPGRRSEEDVINEEQAQAREWDAAHA